MKLANIFVTLVILSQMAFVFPYQWIVVFHGDGLLEGWIMVPSPAPASSPSPEQVASLKELETMNDNLQTSIQEIINFKDTLMNYLQQMELSNLFDEIQSFWNECVDILDAKDAGAFDSEEHFQEVFQDLRQRMRARIFLIIEKIRYEKARLYLEKVRAELIANGADIVTYCVKLTLAIKDYVLHSSQVRGLLNVALSSDPQFKNSIKRLSDDLDEFEGYHEQYVLGSWFNVVKHLLDQGDESFYSGKFFGIFGRQSHIVNWQPDAYFGASNGWVTPLRVTSAPGADIGDYSILLEFQIAGIWRKLCASADPLTGISVITLDCVDEGSKKWKPIPCPSALTANEAQLDYLCVKHVTTGLFLTYVPSLENPGSLTIIPFDANNGNQLFNFDTVRRCCSISNSTGGSQEICLGLNQTSQEALVLPGEIQSFSFAACQADVQLVAFEGRNYSKRTYTIAPGAQMSFVDPTTQATSLLSYYVETVCARIFTDENLTGDYTSVCGDLPNLSEKFTGKNVSVLVASRALELFDGPDYTGNSIVIRRSMMNLDDWPFEVRSVRFSQ